MRLISSKSIYHNTAAHADWERQPGQTIAAAQPKSRLRLRPRDWLILALIAVVLCLLVFGGALLVAQRQTIFPGVNVNGTRLSGMTESQATAALRLAGWNGTDSTVLRVELPGENEMSIRTGVAGWSVSAQTAARAAAEYGRQGSLITNFFSWLRSSLFRYNAGKALSAPVDTDALHQQVEETVRQVNVDMAGGNLEIDYDNALLRVTKGAELFLSDPEEVYQQTLTALEKHKSTLRCVRTADAEAKVRELDLQELHDQICGDPVNAWFDTETMEVADARPGVEFDAANAQRLWDAANSGDAVEIPLAVTNPSFRKSDVEGLYNDLLAIKTTSLGGSSHNRVNNVTMAAEKIFNTILYPGQSFSYNEALGQRTVEAGFREAGAYADGQVVQEVGGGICQVSSTLYWCAMRANLKILERVNHYFSVGYIEPGMDATVSWGGPDFRFENNRTFPIVILANVQNGGLTVEIWGTDVDGTYASVNYAMNGMVAVTYRHVYDRDGNELSCETEAVSTYHPHTT